MYEEMPEVAVESGVTQSSSSACNDTCIDLRKLLDSELEAFRQAGATILLSGAPIALTATVAMPLALTIHGLAVNAAKRGLATVLSDRVWVGWLRQGNCFALRWEESHCDNPIPDLAGVNVLRSLVEGQLHGKMDVFSSEDGVTVLLRVPIH